MECQSCGNDEGTNEAHSCPFAEEIWHDDGEICNCCEECEYQCAMDI